MTGFLEKDEHGFRILPRLRGLGAPVTKSAALLSVSMHPFEWRRIAVTLFSDGAGSPSEALASPYPTKSTTCAPIGLLPDSRAFPATSATLPELALRLIPPLASGEGKDPPTLPKFS
jgi:hypothetical protein